MKIISFVMVFAQEGVARGVTAHPIFAALTYVRLPDVPKASGSGAGPDVGEIWG